VPRGLPEISKKYLLYSMFRHKPTLWNIYFC